MPSFIVDFPGSIIAISFNIFSFSYDLFAVAKTVKHIMRKVFLR